MRLFILSTIVLFFACGQKQDLELFPSDHLFRQRAYPHGTIDLDATENALKWRQNKMENFKGGETSEWLSLGPTNSSGRVTDIELHPDNDAIVYAGSASGGIFKSDDSGDNWTSIFDDAESLSIGDLAISTQDPNIIYAGTGESNAGGGSLAYDGNGVYRSDDAGENWKSLGPDRVGSIGRIAISHDDPDIAYAACMGQLFVNNPERGVYRTKDGGISWEQVLFLNDSTGAIDLVMHPQNSNLIYAAMWQRIRRVDNREYGGAGSGIYRSEDGGDSWVELTNGLPSSPSRKGRIGLAISESEPNILYAFYANRIGSIEGIFRTEDGGESWEQRSHQGISNVSYQWWFGKIFVHPEDSDRVYTTSLYMYASDDGAGSWQLILPSVHVDQHAVAFSREDSKMIYIGNDGGVYLSHSDEDELVDYKTGMSNYQFYTCEIDPIDPSVIYGGAQDNGVQVVRDESGNWEKIFGGDGFRIIVAPNNNEQIYFESQNGNIWASSNGGEDRYFAASGVHGTFNWNTPLEMDPVNYSTLYTGTQSLFRTRDKGLNWEEISPQLTKNDAPPGNLSYGTLTYIEVSDHDHDHIYIGTDEGNLWRTLDQGNNYDLISGNLPDRWVTSIATDPWNASGVYVCYSGFRYGESTAQIYYSDDHGDNWTDIGKNLPDIPVNDIVVDDLKSNTFYVATDIGVFYTEDNGDNWTLLGTAIPNVPIIDLDYHSDERILVAASYGRGMYKMELGTPSSTVNLSKSDINIYPNPASTYVWIESNRVVREVKLYSSDGVLIKQYHNTNELDVSGLKSGTYIFRIDDGDSVTVKKCLIFI